MQHTPTQNVGEYPLGREGKGGPDRSLLKRLNIDDKAVPHMKMLRNLQADEINI